MTDVDETALPGVGLRHDFETRTGRRVGVVTHQTGRRDLVVYGVDDPDAASESVELTEEEGRTLAELLGGSQITEHLSELAHMVEGLAIDWLLVAETSPLSGKTISGSAVRDRTGASVVAVIHDGDPIPAPGPSQRLDAGDTVVVVGTPESVAQISRLLEGSRPEGSRQDSE